DSSKEDRHGNNPWCKEVHVVCPSACPCIHGTEPKPESHQKEQGLSQRTQQPGFGAPVVFYLPEPEDIDYLDQFLFLLLMLLIVRILIPDSLFSSLMSLPVSFRKASSRDSVSVRFFISSTVPDSIIFPWSMIAIWSATASASSI